MSELALLIQDISLVYICVTLEQILNQLRKIKGAS